MDKCCIDVVHAAADHLSVACVDPDMAGGDDQVAGRGSSDHRSVLEELRRGKVPYALAVERKARSTRMVQSWVAPIWE
jgi:hypothetical protein